MSFAFDVTLAWDASAEPVTGYRLHYGFSSGNYEVHTDDLGKVTTHRLTGLADGVPHYFAVTALNGATESGYSNEVVYPEIVSTPQPPSGPTNVQAWAAYQYTTGGAVSNTGDAVQYRFSWGDGTDSGWLPAGTVVATKRWETAATYTDVKVEARCAAHPGVVSAYSSLITVTVEPAPGEVVTDPASPAGPGDARTGVVYGYVTGGALSSVGDPLEYRFQWGDGTASDWTDPGTDGTVKAWKSWSVAGIYDVVAEARCALHPGVTEVSAVAPVSVVGGDSLRLADSFSDGTAAGDPQWKVLSGRWLVGADKVFTAARTDVVNRAVVRSLAKFKAGRVSTKLRLTNASLRQETGIIFAAKDAQHYRYVTVSGSRIAIGQLGDTAKVKGGVKASVARSFAADRWHQVRVDILPNGTVKVFLGTSRKPALTYRFADVPAGSVGCLAANSVAYFDDFRVWDARVLR